MDRRNYTTQKCTVIVTRLYSRLSSLVGFYTNDFSGRTAIARSSKVSRWTSRGRLQHRDAGWYRRLIKAPDSDPAPRTCPARSRRRRCPRMIYTGWSRENGGEEEREREKERRARDEVAEIHDVA